jgi:DNA-binding NarL/FixJ family response regulator
LRPAALAPKSFTHQIKFLLPHSRADFFINTVPYKNTMSKNKSIFPDNLTLTEVEIIVDHMNGKSRKDISREKPCALATVDAHIRTIHQKTKTHDVQSMINYGRKNKLDKKLAAAKK